jgi:hypothetical protein
MGWVFGEQQRHAQDLRSRPNALPKCASPRFVSLGPKVDDARDSGCATRRQIIVFGRLGVSFGEPLRRLWQGCERLVSLTKELGDPDNIALQLIRFGPH